jgi:hypothetical protein
MSRESSPIPYADASIPSQSDRAERAASSRILSVSAHLTAVVLLVGYSGFLISYLTFRTTELPFTSFEGFLKAGTYRLGVLSNSIHYTYFEVLLGFKSCLLSTDHKLIPARIVLFVTIQRENIHP